jgi:hypothetical protein
LTSVCIPVYNSEVGKPDSGELERFPHSFGSQPGGVVAWSRRRSARPRNTEVVAH